MIMGYCNSAKSCGLMHEQLVLILVAANLTIIWWSVTSSGAEAAGGAAAAAVTKLHVVGEGQGNWTLPVGASVQLNYTSWAGRQTFHVGDTLVFQYDPELHNVLQVNEDDYDNCNADAPLATFSDGNTTIFLNGSGMWYFICGFPDHCSLGQKVALRCLDSTHHKHLATRASSERHSTSIPYFSSTPSIPPYDPTPSIFDTPYFDTPSPPTSDTPYFTPASPSSPDTLNPNPPPPTFNTPPPTPNYPLPPPPPQPLPPSDSSASGSSSTNNDPPHSISPPSMECPFDHQFRAPPPLITTSLPPPPPAAPNMPHPLLKSKSQSPLATTNIYVLESFLIGVMATLMNLV